MEESVGSSATEVETSAEGTEEILVEPPKPPERPNSKEIWAEIEDEFYAKRRQIEEYQISKNPDLNYPPLTHPKVAYLNRVIFPTLNRALAEMLRKFTEQQCFFMEEEFLFNGLDFLSEYLWNRNPRHPRRHKQWADIATIVLYWRTPK